MSSYYYLYCITFDISKEDIKDINGFNQEEVMIVRYKDICGIVSHTFVSRYEPNIENLQCHEQVINQCMSICTVLPLSFSTIVGDYNSIEKLLETYYIQFKNNLEKVKDKVELGVKIFYNLKTNEKEKIQASNPKDYMKIKYEIYQKQKMEIEDLAKTMDSIHEHLSKQACDSQLTKPFKNNLVFNGAYLVEKTNISSFKDCVTQIKNEYKEYKLIYSGPWSPYHFIKLEKDGDCDG